MDCALWPLVLRDDLVRAFRPGEPAEREAPFRTLRAHEWATAGVAVHTRQGGRAAGRVVVFSVLNVDAAICARCGDVTLAAAIAKAAARMEEDPTFVRLQTSLAEHAAGVVSSIAEGELAAANPFVDLIRQLATKTAAVRLQHRFAKLAAWYHVGRISSVAEAYVTIEGGGKQSLVPRNLARAVFRERVGECLAIMNRPVDGREMIVRAVPGITLEPKRDSYSPFERPASGFQRVSAADLAYLRGVPKPFEITIPITIER
jgi:hypothetical protein